jgi:hypothetical protein
MTERTFMIDVQQPPVPVVIHESCDHHSSWRLWYDRREDIKTILESNYPEINRHTIKTLLFQIELLQTLEDDTFDKYLLNAVEWAAKRGKP